MRYLNDRSAEAKVLGTLGRAFTALSENSRAVDHSEQALMLSRELGDRRDPKRPSDPDQVTKENAARKYGYWRARVSNRLPDCGHSPLHTMPSKVKISISAGKQSFEQNINHLSADSAR